MERAWFSFWHVLWSGEWVANVGLPLLVSVAAIVVAYLFFKAQLAHDTAQVRADIERSRLAAGHERRRSAVVPFGRRLRELTRSPGNDMALATDQHYLDLVWSAVVDVQDQLGEVELLGQAADWAADYDLRREAVLRWRELLKPGVWETRDVQYAVLRWLEPPLSAMTEVAQVCLRWDGAAPLASSQVTTAYPVQLWMASVVAAPERAALESRYDDQWHQHLGTYLAPVADSRYLK